MEGEWGSSEVVVVREALDSSRDLGMVTKEGTAIGG
jgi:hypothetical protein